MLDSSGNGMIHYASLQGDIQAINYLMSLENANIDFQNTNQSTALLCAAEFGKSEVSFNFFSLFSSYGKKNKN